jgi:hypothetical protein
LLFSPVRDCSPCSLTVNPPAWSWSTEATRLLPHRTAIPCSTSLKIKPRTVASAPRCGRIDCTVYKIAERLGNVDRTIFLLEWISNQPMRQEVTAMTNKVEGYHSFSKWLRFGGEVIAENDSDEQQKYLRYICWPRP